MTHYVFSEGEVPLVADDRVFADVFSEQRTAIYRLALVLSGDAFVAEEVTAEVFARVLPRWRRGQVPEPVFYLRRAVVNEVRSRFRRRANERRAVARYASRPAPTIDASESVGLSGPLIDALQQLSVRQRTILVLRFHDDLSVAEVARIVRSPEATIKTQTRRALTALRAILEEQP